MSTKINAGNGTTGAAISADTTGILELQTGSTPTTAVYINTSQNVGIGTSSPSYKVDVQIGSESSLNLYNTTATSNDSVQTQISSFNGTYWNQLSCNASSYVWKTYNTERMRIDSSGNLLIAGTNASQSAGNGIKLLGSGGGTDVPTMSIVGNSSNGGQGSYHLYSSALGQYQFYVTYNGTIAARSTSITGLSDISEKKNIKDLDTGLNEIMSLKPRRFDWINGEGENIAGFIAQEVKEVLPDLIQPYKLSNDEEKLGLKMGDMLPTLVKAIQELKAELDATKAEVAALKGTK